MPFIDDDFLLETKAARHLYHKYAEPQPILDFHSHLSPQDIAENRRFANLYEIWLEGDHYKWRAMRANGVPERYCTGDATPQEKFHAWAGTVPHCLRNPLYHWTHLELKRYFGTDELLDEKTGPAIWERADELLAGEDLRVQGILAQFKVRALCTTDDPAADLTAHVQIATSGLPTRVYPTFRPDRALRVDSPATFNPWVDRLSEVSNTHVARFSDLLDALRKRHRDFHEVGCRLSDHGLAHCYEQSSTESLAAAIFDKARSGHAACAEEHAIYGSFLMDFFGHLDAQSGWTKQLHLGPIRNVNTRAFELVGADAGFDSLGDWPQATALGRYLDRLEREQALPQMIIYNVNPSQNYPIATMAGNFQDGSVPGKIQFGSAWWFLDQREGMEDQLNTLSNTGLLSRFVGMLTDSRSFMSFPRHEYFRRILCNMLGREIESGEIPDREDLVGPMIEDICYRNASRYLRLGEAKS
jgi:glucuronate isomerase